MLKGLACLCFIIGSGGIGMIKAYELKKKQEELVYIKYMMSCLRSCLCSHRGTFGETCLEVSRKLKAPYDGLFLELYQLLELERNLSPKDYWEQKWEEVSKKLLLKNNELEIIKGMIRCADATTVSLPAEILQQIMEEWDKVIYNAEQVKKNYTRVSLCLGFSVGMVLCISVL